MENQLGNVVLIDFWTYSCINCIRTLPFLQAWHERYADEGLVILGVHTPEFEFEKVYDNVVEATEEMGVAWPVVQDNDFSVWDSYSNRFWPAKYLIDRNGVIRYRHFGEGRYAETEQEIRNLLAEVAPRLTHWLCPARGPAARPAYATERSLQRTPELFAGWTFTTIQGRGGLARRRPTLRRLRPRTSVGTRPQRLASLRLLGHKLLSTTSISRGPGPLDPRTPATPERPRTSNRTLSC